MLSETLSDSPNSRLELYRYLEAQMRAVAAITEGLYLVRVMSSVKS